MKFKDCEIGMKVTLHRGTQLDGHTLVINDIDKEHQFVHLIDLDSKYRTCWLACDDLDTLKVKWLEPLSSPKRKKVPKFDMQLTESDSWCSYITDLVIDLTDEIYGHDDVCISEFYLYEDGTIKVKDSKGNKGKAKCHPDDPFNPEIGLHLAIERAHKKGVKWTPAVSDNFYSVDDADGTINKSVKIGMSWFKDDINISLGNCFRTLEEAREHKDEVVDKMNKLFQYARKINKGEV